MDIIDVSFNFDLFEDVISNLLNTYNIAKEQFNEGFETKDGVKKIVDRLSQILELSADLAEIRIDYIDKKVNTCAKLTFQDKDDLLYEKNCLSEDIEWYDRLKNSVLTEYYNLVSNVEVEGLDPDEYDFQDESEME